MRCFRTGRIVDIVRVLTLEVWGENRVDSAAVNMIAVPMTMVSLRVDMEQWDHEHPRDQPEHDKYTESRHA